MIIELPNSIMSNPKFQVISRSLVSFMILGTSLLSVKSAQAFVQSDVDIFLENQGLCNEGDLSGADFHGTAFDESPMFMYGCDARKANFSNVLIYDFNTFGPNRIDESNFSNANFSNSEINRIQGISDIFVNTNFTGVNFVAPSTFEDSDFSGADFTRADIDYLEIYNTRPTLSKFNDTSPSTSFRNTIFTDAVVRNSSFTNVDFAGASLSGATFKNVDLTGARITNQQLSSLNSFSGILPDGTRVTAVPEPQPVNIFGATTLLGLLGIVSTALKKRKISN